MVYGLLYFTFAIGTWSKVDKAGYMLDWQERAIDALLD